MSNIIKSGSSADLANVDTSKNLQVITPGNNASGTTIGGGNANAPALMSEVDPGTITLARLVRSPEVEPDYRLRSALETLLDIENFNYTAQNTGKHTYSTTTLTAGWTTGGLTTNASGITTTTTGMTLGTYQEYPLLGANNLYVEFEASLSANVTTNFVIDFGLFRRGASTPYLPTDGIYFRINPSGFSGVVNYNTVETATSTFSFVPVANTKYQFIIVISLRAVEFYINNVLYGSIPTPAGQGQPCLSATLPLSVRHANTGTAGGVIQLTFNNYNVSLGGTVIARTLGELGNAALGSYQGLSGGIMGGLTVYTNSTNPTAAVPTNTTLAANLPAGLGGQSWETFSLALNTDGILMSYQVSAGSISIQGKRLKITGVKMSAYVQTVLAGGPCNSTFSLSYGSTAVSLATAEGAAAKSRRVVLLPEFTQAITATQAVNTMISQPGGCISMFPEPIYVNPGEFVQFVVKHIGTVGTAGTIAYNIQYIYSWE